MRTITDEDGRAWEVVPVEGRGAHLKRGASLGFRPAEPIKTTITFNSLEAADFAIGTMSEKELLRRLAWAKTEAGIA